MGTTAPRRRGASRSLTRHPIQSCGDSHQAPFHSYEWSGILGQVRGGECSSTASTLWLGGGRRQQAEAHWEAPIASLPLESGVTSRHTKCGRSCLFEPTAHMCSYCSRPASRRKPRRRGAKVPWRIRESRPLLETEGQ